MNAPNTATEGAPRSRAPVERDGDATADASGPSDLSAGQWSGAMRETVSVYRARGLGNWAAALSYYGILALFPAVIALVSLLGVLGDGLVNPLIENLSSAAPGPARDLLLQAVTGIAENPESSLVLFIGGLALALWAASGYVNAFMSASNDIYGVEESRPIWRRLPARVAITAVQITLIGMCAIAVVLTADLASRAGELLGIGETAVEVWDIAKWPVMAIMLSLALAVLYWAAPNVKHPGFRWVTAGSVAAIAIWVAASALFAVYVANFGSYDATYGALGGVVVFLIWLWISNVAVLFGATLNSRIELRSDQQVETGHAVPTTDVDADSGAADRSRVEQRDPAQRSV